MNLEQTFQVSLAIVDISWSISSCMTYVKICCHGYASWTTLWDWVFLFEWQNSHWNFETYQIMLKSYGKAAFTSERKQNANANAAFKNDANIRCRRIPEAKQTAFSCVTNVRRTAECYPSTVGTSKGIRVQYVYVGSIRCLGERRTIYRFTHMNVRIVFACRVRVCVPM